MPNRHEPKAPDNLLPIDFVMTALENALHSGLTLEDVVELGNFAQSIEDWDAAISLYSIGWKGEDEVVPEDNHLSRLIRKK